MVRIQWIPEAWKLFCRSADAWVSVTLAFGIVYVLGRVAIGAAFGAALAAIVPSDEITFLTPVSQMPTGGAILEDLFSFLYGSCVSTALAFMALRQVRGEPIGFSCIWSGARYFVPMTLFNLLTLVLASLGALICFVGSLFVLGIALPGPAMIVDGQPVTTAVARGHAAMDNSWLQPVFVFAEVLAVVMSAMPCGLGLLVSLPMIYIVSSLAYRDQIGLPHVAGPSDDPGEVWPPAPDHTPRS
jgi:uncharacterized membrane protein